MVAVAAIPWKTIMGVAPDVVIAAKRLLQSWGTTPRPQVDPQAEVKIQIAAIVDRLQTLEAAEIEQAKLIKQIAEHLEGTSAGLMHASRRATVGVWLGAAAFTVSLLTLFLVLLR